MTQILSPIPINPYSRSGKPLKTVQALVIHWTAAPGQHAAGVVAYYRQRSQGKDGYGGAHYAIDLNGDVVAMIPEAEVAYHCGTSQLDPASGKFYTDAARDKFGQYAIDYKDLSPNLVTLGIEHCITDALGTMTDETRGASVELAADICRRYNLDPVTDLMLHKDVVGWKDCHKWFVDHPDDWQAYKEQVAQAVANA